QAPPGGSSRPPPPAPPYARGESRSPPGRGRRREPIARRTRHRAGRARSTRRRLVQRAPRPLQLLAHTRERRSALGRLGLDPRALTQHLDQALAELRRELGELLV